MKSWHIAVVSLVAMGGAFAVVDQTCAAQPTDTKNLSIADVFDQKDRQRIQTLKNVQQVLQSSLKPRADQIVKLLAESTGSDVRYDLLLKLAEIEKAKGTREGDDAATGCLLEASVLKPERSEAEVRLADMNISRGSMPEGERHLRRALTSLKGRTDYDATCFQVQTYMDQCNYGPAISTLIKKAVAKNGPFADDPYLTHKLYQCVLQDTSESPFWATELYCALYSYSPERIRAVKLQLVRKGFSQFHVDPVVSRLLKENSIARLRKSIDVTDKYEEQRPGSSPRYKLQDANLLVSPKPVIQLDENMDLFKLALRASVPDEKTLDKLLFELENLRAQAKNHCSSGTTKKEQAEQLFIWLKENMLKEYSVAYGIPAENAILKKQYLCLTGTIYYTLIARKDLGLDVSGFLTKNHAFAVFHDNGKTVEVETTASGDKRQSGYGFDFENKRTDETKQKHDDYRQQAAHQDPDSLFSVASVGEVSPLDLVNTQHANVVSNLPTFLLLQNQKYMDEAAKILGSLLSEEDLAKAKKRREHFDRGNGNKPPDYTWDKPSFTWKDFLETLTLVAYEDAEKMLSRRVIPELADQNEQFRKDLLRTYDRILALSETAIALNPYNAELKDRYILQLQRANNIEVNPEYYRSVRNFHALHALIELENELITELKQQQRARKVPTKSLEPEGGAISTDGKAQQMETQSKTAKDIADDTFSIERTEAMFRAFNNTFKRTKTAAETYPRSPEIKRLLLSEIHMLQKYLYLMEKMKTKVEARGATDVKYPDLYECKTLLSKMLLEQGIKTSTF